MKKNVILILFFFWLCFTPRISAQKTESREQIVWGIITSENDSYFGVFSPEKCDIYLIEGNCQVFLPQKTNVYYWPITKEYKADWQSLDIPILGTMQVKNLKTGDITSVTPQPYMVFTDVETGRYIMLNGQEAVDRYDSYLARRQSYLDAVSEYDSLFYQYQIEKETNPEAKAPVYPETFTEYLTAPDLGFVTNFSAGKYEISIFDENDHEIPESKRTVEVIKPNNDGYSYVIIPENKWTYKQTLAPEDEVLYVSRLNKNIFLQIQKAFQYNEYAYTKFRSPQSIKGSQSRMVWAAGTPINDLRIQIKNADGIIETESKEYRVIQNSGSKLGYQIRERTESDSRSADFTAYHIPVNNTDSKIELSLLDSQGISVQSNSQKIIVIGETFPFLAFIVILLPIAVFFTVKRIWK